MGESDQPYIYMPQRTVYPYSGFNPKAVTQAEYKKVQDEKKEKSKPEGPLINFNAHPDSYMIVGAKQPRYTPMPARTKTEVTVIRWIQFALRVIEELGALGMLVCVICIQDVELSLVWIMRLAPAWDILVTLYAIYHLVRPARARTPGSSASYHFFALFMDTGIIPFYVFIAMFSNKNWRLDPKDKLRWTSMFKGDQETSTVLFAAFVGACSIAGLHLLSAVFDLWLVILFRKIGKLPPDMNPLEDNLTGRTSRQSKHKYKNSEATLTGSFTEKKSAYFSGSTVSVDQRSRLSTATKDDGEFRGVPFQHSRMNSQTTFSPHTPDTARYSRQQFEDVNLYGQTHSARSSRVDLNGPPSPSKRSSFVEHTEVPPPPPRNVDRLNSMRPMSYPTNRSNTDLTNPARFSSPALPNAAPTNALVRSQQQQGLLNDNWISVDDDEAADMHFSSQNRAQVPDIYIDRHDSFEHQPLKMNPPTPPPQNPYEFPDADDDQPLRVHQKRAALTYRNDNGNGSLAIDRMDTTGSSVYSESSPSLKSSKTGRTPKGKYYGDLAAATLGVRGSPKAPSPRIKSNDTLKSNGTLAAATMDSTGMMALGEYGFAPDPPRKNKTPQKIRDVGGRVVSTGVDYTNAQAPYPSMGMNRREVSGKVAEEGRGGGWFGRGRY